MRDQVVFGADVINSNLLFFDKRCSPNNLLRDFLTFSI